MHCTTNTNTVCAVQYLVNKLCDTGLPVYVTIPVAGAGGNSHAAKIETFWQTAFGRCLEPRLFPPAAPCQCQFFSHPPTPITACTCCSDRLLLEPSRCASSTSVKRGARRCVGCFYCFSREKLIPPGRRNREPKPSWTVRGEVRCATLSP